MADKLTATITFHCSEELKSQLMGIANANGLDLSTHCRTVLEADRDSVRLKASVLADLFGLPQIPERT